MDGFSKSARKQSTKSQSGGGEPAYTAEASDHSGTQRSRRGSRTSNACEQCQRRKTKCTGPPVCEACAKVGLVCHFETKITLKTRMRSTYSAEDERLQYMLNGLLSALKHNEAQMVNELVSVLQANRSPQEIATHLRQNLLALQENGHIPRKDIDDAGLISLISRLDTPNLLTQFSVDGDADGESTESPQSSQEDWQMQTPTSAGFAYDPVRTTLDAPSAGIAYSSSSVSQVPQFHNPFVVNPYAQPGLQTPGAPASTFTDPTLSANTGQTSWYALQRQNEYSNRINRFHGTYQPNPQDYFHSPTQPQAQAQFTTSESSSSSGGNFQQDFTVQNSYAIGAQPGFSTNPIQPPPMQLNAYQGGAGYQGVMLDRRQLPPFQGRPRTDQVDGHSEPYQRHMLDQEDDLCRQQ